MPSPTFSLSSDPLQNNVVPFPFHEQRLFAQDLATSIHTTYDGLWFDGQEADPYSDLFAPLTSVPQLTPLGFEFENYEASLSFAFPSEPNHFSQDVNW